MVKLYQKMFKADKFVNIGKVSSLFLCSDILSGQTSKLPNFQTSANLIPVFQLQLQSEFFSQRAWKSAPRRFLLR